MLDFEVLLLATKIEYVDYTHPEPSPCFFCRLGIFPLYLQAKKKPTAQIAHLVFPYAQSQR